MCADFQFLVEDNSHGSLLKNLSFLFSVLFFVTFLV